jgi:hypothetical protein
MPVSLSRQQWRHATQGDTPVFRSGFLRGYLEVCLTAPDSGQVILANLEILRQCLRDRFGASGG